VNSKKPTDRFRLVDDELTQALKDSEEERKAWLFLEPHPEFQGRWVVSGFTQSFFFEMRDLIGPYKVVSPATLDKFLEMSESLGYRVAFFGSPEDILEPYERLDAPPEVRIDSAFNKTVNGLLPFQARGFNFLKDLDGGVALWSTGTGKTVFTCGLVQYHAPKTDVTFIVAKAHNKINTQRALKRLANVGSLVIDGDKKRRRKLYAEVNKMIGEGLHPVVVLNYEKFRVDKDDLKALFEDNHVMVVWDEMPTRLKTRTSQLYKGVVSCLYRTSPPAVSWHKKRAKSLRQFMLSATPIENDPEDFFNCVRLIDPRVYGTVDQFHDEYVASYSYFDPFKPSKWHNLDRMGLKAAHMVHQADKEKDPEIKAMFPDVIPETIYVDWDNKNRAIYDLLTKQAAKLDLEEANVLALIGVMQMLCDAPTMVNNSAAHREAYEAAMEVWADMGGKEPKIKGSTVAQQLVAALGAKNLSDEHHTKLSTVRELLCETHPDEKVLIYSAFNEGLMPIMEDKLREWNVSYVRYTGTPKQKQAAEDAFMTDPDVQVFLSSDMGSDSLSLGAGSVVIHYDLPWKWSTYTQRENRVHRVDSEFDTVRYYTLLMADSVEDRKIEIIEKKLGFHDQIFNGDIADQAASAKMTREDLWYILTGQSPSP
jgi:superfamily II DNA or RNA helicase